ncbi:hypothetical protein [Winogradskyella sp. PE311]|uniref:hypothetical protein n=1 Tax=Winogradskyella sp. PE311 TaxID=3366943 RepID=UPI00397F921E
MKKVYSLFTKNLIYTFLAFTFLNFSNAQISNENIYLFGHMNAERDKQNTNYNDLTYSIEKSDEFKWQNISVIIEGELENVFGRYNPMQDTIEVKDADKIYEIAKRNNLRVTFTESGKVYQVKSYYGNDDKIHKSYFITSNFSKELGVFKRERFKKNELKKYKRKANGTIYFDKSFVYYMLDKDNKLLQLTTNRKTIKNTFPTQAKSIINYIKSNDLSSKNEKDIIVLAQYIKSLKSKN